MKRRKVICSMTSIGLLMPPDQKASQTRSTLLFKSPVIVNCLPLDVWPAVPPDPNRTLYSGSATLREVRCGLSR